VLLREDMVQADGKLPWGTRHHWRHRFHTGILAAISRAAGMAGSYVLQVEVRVVLLEVCSKHQTPISGMPSRFLTTLICYEMF